MTERNERRTDPFNLANEAERHRRSRKGRHQKRPCGGNQPTTPTGLTFEWETTEKGRGRRLSVMLNWSPVRTNTAGARSTMRRYRVQLQRSLDAGVTRSGRTRKWVVPEATVRKALSASIVSGTTAEFVLDSVHDLDTGDTVTISGMAPAGYNGTWTVSATPASNTFRADIGTSPGASTSSGEAFEDVTSLEVRAVRKHVWYRFRVQAENTDGCISEWSAWTSWTLANDHMAPPSPLNVKIYAASTNRIVIDWDDPVAYLPLEGTVSASGTTTLTGTGTFFNAQVGVGSKIRIGTAGDVRTVTAIASDTSLTADAAFGTFSAQVPYLEERDPDVAGYGVWLDTVVGFTPPAYKRERKQTGTRVSFRIPDADSGLTFFGRVLSFDASENRSLWIPATIAGNSSAGATPDGVMVGAGGGSRIRFTFSKPGRLRVRLYRHREVNNTGELVTLDRARAEISEHVHGSHPDGDGAPTGTGPVRIQFHLYSNIIGVLNTTVDASTTTWLVDEETTPPSTPFEMSLDTELVNVTARSGASNPRTYTVTRNIDGEGAASHTASSTAYCYADPAEKHTGWSKVKTAIMNTDDRLKVEPSSHMAAKPSSAFAVTTIRPDEFVQMEIKNVSSGFPGEDLTAQLIGHTG